MKVELTITELRTIIGTLCTTQVNYLKQSAREPADSFRAVSYANHAEFCRNLADRLDSKLKPADKMAQISRIANS